MEPGSGSRLSVIQPQDLSAVSEDDRDYSPARKNSKVKQKRKASMASSKDNGKTKSRTSKSRQSLAPTTHEMSDALNFVKTWNLKPDDGDHLSTFKGVQIDADVSSDEATPDLAQLTLKDKRMSLSVPRNEATSLRKDEYRGDGIHSTLKETLSGPIEEERNVDLEEKLANDHEFDAIGIMNLASMNLTDNDLPAILQRAFCGGPKKCSGLILRDNALTSEGVRVIVDSTLAMRMNLKYLSFSNNPSIGDAGLEHLIRLLQKPRSIVFLSIPDTGITDRGVRLLADILCGGGETDAPCPSLEKLYISGNKAITDDSLEALLQILEQNSVLKLLSVEHCSLSDAARRRLKQAGTKMKKRKFSLVQ